MKCSCRVRFPNGNQMTKVISTPRTVFQLTSDAGAHSRTLVKSDANQTKKMSAYSVACTSSIYATLP